MTLSTSGLSASESLKQFLFNYNGALSALKFSRVSGEVADIKVGSDKFKAGGDGKYDIRFQYQTGKKDNRFVGKETSIYDIQAAGLTAQSFAVKSAGHGHKPTYFAAAEVLMKGRDAWVASPLAAVPEPEAYAMMLAGLGFVSLAALRRRKKLSI